MAKAVIWHMASGSPASLVPPPAGPTARKFGLRAEQIEFLWQRRYERVGTNGLKRIAEHFGCKLGTRNGQTVVVPVGDYLPTFPDIGLNAVPISPEALSARALARGGASAERAAEMGRVEFSYRMGAGK
jgi:hypothetical protein